MLNLSFGFYPQRDCQQFLKLLKKISFKHNKYQKIQFSILCICLNFILSMPILSHAQIKITYNGRIADTLKIDKYKIGSPLFEHFTLIMKPGDYRIIDLNSINKHKKNTVTMVDLVYSDYPENEDFKELNRKRILELFMHFPEVFRERSIVWRVVKQTGIKNNSQLNNYFHGFVIYYRKDLDFDDEKKYLSEVMESKVAPKDSTILKVFDRNKNLKNMPVVVDVTGSMSPYTAQLFLWLKTNIEDKRFSEFVFFNDDDMLNLTQENKIDSSGMLKIRASNLDSVLLCCNKAMANSGQLENNIKSLFYTKKCFSKSAKNGIVMIADNWQTPEDLSVLKDFATYKIPVHIIVCGVADYINPCYLEIVQQTGGTLHTMEEDLLYLKNLKEGEKVLF
jgi:hypothetical protein